MEPQPEISQEQEPAPPRRSSMGLAVLAFFAVIVSAAGAMFYYASQARQQQSGSGLDVAGFDVAKVDDAPQRAAAPAAAPSQPQASSLGMLSAGAGYGFTTSEQNRDGGAGGQAGQGAAAAEAGGPQKFTDICRANESRARDLAMAYTKKYPAIAQYGRDWMSKPDLKKLNDDYMKDRDPVKFIRGLANSPSFPGLIKKYATDPAIRGFAKDVIKNAPSGLVSAGVDIAKKEGMVNKLMDNVMGALGLPPGMFGNSSAPGKNPQLDQNQIMNSVMNNNPDMQRAMGQQQQAAPRLSGGFGNFGNQQQGQGQEGQPGQPGAGGMPQGMPAGMPAGMPDIGAMMGGAGGGAGGAMPAGIQGMLNNPQMSEALKNTPGAQDQINNAMGGGH